MSVLSIPAVCAATGGTPADDLKKARAMAHSDNFHGAVSAYDAIIAKYPDTAEAINARIGKARCLHELGRDDEGIVLLEAVAREHPGTDYAVRAMLLLGSIYEGREDRDRARVFYTRALEASPPESQWSRMAKSQLNSLDQYHYSFFYDWLERSIKIQVVERVTGLRDRIPDESAAKFILTSTLLRFMIRVGALGICLVLLLASQRICPVRSGDPGILRRAWTVRRLSVLLVGAWTLSVALGVVSAASELRPESSFGRIASVAFPYVTLDGYLLESLLLVGVMWKEPLRDLFAVPWSALLRALKLLGLATLGLLAAITILGLMFNVLKSHGLSRNTTTWLWPGLDKGTPWGRVLFFYLLGAASEEAVFRGAVYHAFRRHTSTLLAALLSSTLFAAIHLYPLRQALAILAFGLLLTWLLERTRSFTPPTLLHWGLNLLVHAGRR